MTGTRCTGTIVSNPDERQWGWGWGLPNFPRFALFVAVLFVVEYTFYPSHRTKQADRPTDRAKRGGFLGDRGIGVTQTQVFFHERSD